MKSYKFKNLKKCANGAYVCKYKNLGGCKYKKSCKDKKVDIYKLQ